MDTLGLRENGCRRIWTVLAGTVLLAIAIFFAGYSAGEATTTPLPISSASATRNPGFADLVEAVKPAVVNISTTEVANQQVSSQADEDGTFGNTLNQFLGPNADEMLRKRSGPEHTLGSGFLIDSTGYIVTNNHVIEDANGIQVALADGSSYPARIVGRDTKTDLALLKINAKGPLSFVVFGNSDKERAGDWVIAVGNPYGLGGSVSAGIISGSNRDIDDGPYDDFLQIDAPINPGNSGGPLFNQAGQVVGIDTAIYSPTGGSVGIGFAIPSNIARKVIEALREHGHVTRGWLGVQYQSITPQLAKAVGLNATKGVLVDLAMKDSPAASAGVEQGDVIVSFHGKPIGSSLDLAFAVAGTPSGLTVPLVVWRDGRQRLLLVTVGTEQTSKIAISDSGTQLDAFGLELAPVSADQRAEQGLTSGAAVASVIPGSLADNCGIQPGDIITGIGNRKVISPADAVAQIRAAENENKPALPLLILRDGTSTYFPLELRGD